MVMMVSVVSSDEYGKQGPKLLYVGHCGLVSIFWHIIAARPKAKQVGVCAVW